MNANNRASVCGRVGQTARAAETEKLKFDCVSTTNAGLTSALTAPSNAELNPTIQTQPSGECGERLLDMQAVLRRVPVSRSTIYNWMRTGAFPRGQRYGPRKRLWRASVIDDFVRGM